MSDILPRRHFLWPGLTFPFIVQVRVNDSRVTLRTWKLSADVKLSEVLSLEEAIYLIGEHAEPLVIKQNPLGNTTAGLERWVPLHALGGVVQSGLRTTNLYVSAVSEVGFIIDKSILGSAAWSDFGLWVFNAKRNGMLELPFNRFIKTYSTKEHRHLLMTSRHEVNLLMICVPFSRPDFNHCSFVLKYNKNLGCVHNLDAPHLMPNVIAGYGSYDFEGLFGVKALLPALRLLGPSFVGADSAALCHAEMFDRNSDLIITNEPVRIYLEADAGYLPQRQIQMMMGKSSFRICANGLIPGEKIKLKAGWRNYSGAAEKIITVI